MDEFIAAFEGDVPLTRPFLICGPGGLMVEVLVDAADFDHVMPGSAWRMLRTNYGKPGPALFYVVRGRSEYLHRVVMADELAAWTGPDRAVVDHINGSRLYNRRCNLRVVTQSENITNSRKSSPESSRLKGVSRYNGARWRALISRRGRQVHLGYFNSEEDAARAYDAAARDEFGEYACLNLALEGEQCALPPHPADEPQA